MNESRFDGVIHKGSDGLQVEVLVKMGVLSSVCASTVCLVCPSTLCPVCVLLHCVLCVSFHTCPVCASTLCPMCAPPHCVLCVLPHLSCIHVHLFFSLSLPSFFLPSPLLFCTESVLCLAGGMHRCTSEADEEDWFLS